MQGVINTTPQSSQPTPPPVRKPFAKWTLADARAVIEYVINRRVGKDGFTANWRYAQDHDHLQDMKGWIGPEGVDTTAARSRNKTGVERQFTPVDAIAEVLDNLTNALLQTRSSIGLELLEPVEEQSETAKKAQQQEIAALTGILTRWAEKRKFWVKARKAVKRSRWATWGTLRAWIPESAVDPQARAGGPNETGTTNASGNTPDVEEKDHAEQQTTIPLPTGMTLEDALCKVSLSAPDPDQSFVYVDPDTEQTVGIFLYADQQREFVELVWMDEDTKKTTFRVLSRGMDVDETTLDLGGLLPIAQMEGELLITEPVRMQQAQLNFANSIMTRVMETAGFPERVVIDGMPEGEWTDAEPTTPVLEVQTDATGKRWFLVPTDGPTLGAGVVREIRSMADDGPNNTTSARSAQVIKFDPTDPEYIIKAKKDARATILRQCKQGHIDMDGDAGASGFSRVQARANHLADVTNMQDPLQTMLRETLEAVLHYAALMSQEAVALLAKYRVIVSIQVDLGPVDPQERTAILDMLKAGALSLPSALGLLQIDDVQAEIERIRSQPESQRATLKGQAEVGGLFVMQWGLDAVTAAKLAGLTPEQVALIQQAQTLADEQQPPVGPDGQPVDPNAPPPNGGPPRQRQLAGAGR